MNEIKQIFIKYIITIATADFLIVSRLKQQFYKQYSKTKTKTKTKTGL